MTEQSNPKTRGFGRFETFREKLFAWCKEGQDIATSQDCPQIFAEIEEVRQRLSRGVFQVSVLGEIKRGKTTLLNAMLGRKILPTAITICTATLNVINYGQTEQAKIFRKDGSVQEIRLDELSQYATKKNKDASNILKFLGFLSLTLGRWMETKPVMSDVRDRMFKKAIEEIQQRLEIIWDSISKQREKLSKEFVRQLEGCLEKPVQNYEVSIARILSEKSRFERKKQERLRELQSIQSRIIDIRRSILASLHEISRMDGS